MNALTPVPPPAPPEPSPSLAYALGVAAEPRRSYPGRDPEDQFSITVRLEPSAADVAEANAILPAHEAAYRPVTRAELASWLKALNAGVRNPQSEDEFAMRLRAFAHACDGLPAGVFTAATLRRAMAEFAFWPAPADVLRLLDPDIRAAGQRLAALRRVASSRPVVRRGAEPEEPRPPPTPAEVDAVRAVVSGLASGIRGRDLPPDPHRRASRPLHPDVIAAARDASPAVQAARRLRDEGGAA
jgi:hypothetical protein